MTNPIRDALDWLNQRLLPTLFGEGVDAAFLQSWASHARAALAAQPPVGDDDDRAALQGLLDRVHLAATDPAAWLGLKQGDGQSPADAPPPAPAASTTPDLDALLSPEGAYEGGTGQEDGAQLVSGPHGPEWWAPLYGCDTLDNLLDRLRARILPHLRPPVTGIDVPGPDGDYGGLQELCAVEGVDPRVGVPLLKRARQAWKVAAQPPAPTPAPALDADTLRKVWREAAWGGRWATLVDYVALAVEAQRAPSGNPPATEEYLAEARQKVAGLSLDLLARRLQNLARVQARDGREYGSALCARAAELIQPASDGEREELAKMLIQEAGSLEAYCNKIVNGECRTLACLQRGGYVRSDGPPDSSVATCPSLEKAGAKRRAATLLRQPAPPPEGLSVMEYIHIDSGARIISEPSEECSGGCWIVRNSRHVNPCTEFRTVADAVAALHPAQGGDVQ